MSDLEEQIPAFSMWKMFNESIIPALLNMEYSEVTMQTLSNITKTQEFLNIFVYNHDPALSYQQYEAISQKYKAFTVWLLGRFFYLMSCDKLSKKHDLLIDAQLRILQYISITQPHIYSELSAEYVSALKQLNDYHKGANETKMILRIFAACQHEDLKHKLDLTPLSVEILSKSVCSNMQKILIKFMHKIISHNIQMYYFKQTIYESVDCLLYVVAECSMELKLEVLEIYVDLLKSHRFYSTRLPLKFIEKWNLFVCYIEQLVYEVYNKNVKIPDADLKKLENILVAVFTNVNNLEKVGTKVQNIAAFLNSKKETQNLQNACFEYLCKVQTFAALEKTFPIEGCMKSVTEKSEYRYLKVVEKQIFSEIKIHIGINLGSQLNVHNSEISPTWNKLYTGVKKKLQTCECEDKCEYPEQLTLFGHVIEMLFSISINIQNYVIEEKGIHALHLLFFPDHEAIYILLTTLNNHMKTCGSAVFSADADRLWLRSAALVPSTSSGNDFEFVFHCISYPFLMKPELLYLCSKTQNEEFNKLTRNLVMYMSRRKRNKEVELQCLYTLMSTVSVQHSLIPRYIKIEKIQDAYFKIVKQAMSSAEGISSEIQSKLVRYHHLPSPATYKHQWINEILLPVLKSQPNDFLLMSTIKAASAVICMSYSEFVPNVSWNLERKDVSVETVCVNCTHYLRGLKNKNEIIKKMLERLTNTKNSIMAAYDVIPPINGNSEEIDAFVEQTLMLCSSNDEVKLCLVKRLSAFSHVQSFHTIDATKLWLKFAADENIEIRMKFSSVVATLFQNAQEHPNLSKQHKDELLQVYFSEFEKYTKDSLQNSKLDLQDTLLETLSKLSTLKIEGLTLHMIQLLLYFIMIPTSGSSLIAANIFMEVASQRGATTNLIYSQYKRELSYSIARFCAINQALRDYTLYVSLQQLSLFLGFFGPKDFVTQESRYLLPVLVSFIPMMPKVEKLVEEAASFHGLRLSELLTSKYGFIFLYVLLNETTEKFKEVMSYVEKNSGLNGSTLRKKNFQLILNELLLNFHEKQHRVLFAITILAREDSEVQTFSTKQIPEYLQPKFLGVLAYFDMKLITRHSDKKKVLHSLVPLLKFMGPKYITPLRFKILAMLRTALNSNYEAFPELNCDVWDAFVRSCETSALGSQLASIFVSLLPLIKQFSQKIDKIFKYLVIENEAYVKDFIPDLFFVVETEVNQEICLVIKKHLQRIENLPFPDQLKSFLKYLNHETVEIQVHGLKYLKRLLEKNREELDRMILGYNGINPIIVELLDILMLGCREKEESVKLACGECIGELGAIEPSHLPRQYKQEDKSFIFFISEDAFIVNALNELTRALQAETNTQNMDRFALAVQEILKVHGISSDPNSPKYNLWKNFSESQRELMLPLLSSKYAMVQSVENVTVSPIYGSKYGTTFQSWVYSWTCNLVLAVNADQRQFLQVCLPSLKQDHRTLMNFLPHILLHALLDNAAEVHSKAYEEIMAVVDSYNNKRLTSPVVKSSFGSGTPLSVQTITAEEVKEDQCTKVIFVLLDFLDRWIREWVWVKGASANEDVQYQTIKDFLSQFCKLQLARCNYQCGEYPRALMYLEEFIKNQPQALNDQFAFLAELYAQLDEPDGVAGVTALQDTEPPLEQRLLTLEVSGKLADAAACYERIHPPLKLHHLQGLVQCYLDLDNVNTALNFVQGAMERQPEYSNILMEIEAEPLWRLGQFTELDSLLKKPEIKNNASWGVQVGRALLHLRDGKRDEFKSVLDALRIAQVESLGAASLEEGAYQHGYSYIAKLHAINELQQIEGTVYELLLRSNDYKVSESVIKQLMSEWELRFKVVQESIRIQEPILCLRRIGIEQAKNLLEARAPHSIPLLNSLLGETWLLSATIARAAGVHQQAYTYTLKAEEYSPPRLFLEKAKLHWLREEHEQALTTLRRGLEVLMPEGTSTPSSSLKNLPAEKSKILAEARLLIASYNDSVSNVDTEVNTQHYKEAVDAYKEWEKSLVCLAQYYDRIFQTLSEKDRDAKGGDMQLHIINYFGKSLVYGSKFVYQSMPRMLSIWFDYGTRLLDIAKDIRADSYEREKKDRENTLLRMTKLIDTFLGRLPAYIFLTAFSQIISRICHPEKHVYIQLKNIIIKLILQYPQQTLWMMISVIKSSYSVRSKRCAEILSDSNLKTTSMIKLIGDFTKLAEKLIELCNKDIPDNVQITTVNALLRTLPRLLTKDDFSEIMIPTQKFRKLILPNPDFQSSQHNPFPNHYVHIVGIEDEVIILQSLQHPRKITFRGSDGQKYIQMLKPKDDLRKDFRLMEFNDIVNQLLSHEPDARQRRLNIRLYSVVPLNEECGLIEWVPKLVGLRPVLLELYKQTGKGIKARELKQLCCNQRDPLAKKREIFIKALLPRHPPVLGEWFRKTFPDAQGWLAARTAYIRTTAVMSMVGYILGLGDRHGENISFDSTCGDTVHVDFNCLFNKGESFEWPERVPFRLTQNMVAAMGPLGVEGVFRKSCACTLRVLRTNANTLMSIVTPFVYDPLVSWPRNAQSSSNAQTAERTNEQAMDHVRNIEVRLQGMVRTKGRSLSIPLSVEGQTNNLIQEAMSIDNLCQMYIGWGPYL